MINNNNNNNNHHQLDQPVITRMTTSPPFRKLLFFCMFSLFNFSSIFPGGQLTPFAPMCGRPWFGALPSIGSSIFAEHTVKRSRTFAQKRSANIERRLDTV